MRAAFLTVLGVDLALIALGVLSYRPLLAQPGSVGYLAAPAGLLLIYAIVVLAASRWTSPTQRRILRVAATVGASVGLLEIVNISVETFINQPHGAHLATTAPLILGPFVIWCGVGGWAARATGARRIGVLASVWCAMVTMVMGVTFGFTLPLIARARLEQILSTDPDYARSGWTDLTAFVFANTFDNGFTHLLGALIVGIVVGLIGGAIGLSWPPRRLTTRGSAPPG